MHTAYHLDGQLRPSLKKGVQMGVQMAVQIGDQNRSRKGPDGVQKGA